MCSLGANEIDGEIDDIKCDSNNCNNVDPTQEMLASSTCGKCRKTVPQIVIRGRNIYCCDCFMAMSIHKFRAQLGKHKTLRANESVLIGHSGKSNSTMLLDLTKTAMEASAKKKLILKPYVLYIDDGAVKGLHAHERQNICKAIQMQLNNLNFIGYVIPLSFCMKDNLTIEALHCLKTNDSYQVVDVSEDKQLDDIFLALADDTARDDFLRRIRHNLLVSVARLLNCEKVFLADTSLDLAVKILTDTATGRAASLSSEVMFLNKISTDVHILKPMREFTQDEMDAYLNERKIAAVLPFSYNNINVPPLWTSSIRKVARDFVHGLDLEFPSTVAAIYRTGNKLVGEKDAVTATIKNDRENTISCVFCGAESTISTESKSLSTELTAIQSTYFSRVVSVSSENDASSVVSNVTGKELNSIHNRAEKDKKDCTNCSCSIDHNSKGELSNATLLNHLCYGCRTIFEGVEVNDTNVLSSFLRRCVRKSLQLNEMRADIEEFLL